MIFYKLSAHHKKWFIINQIAVFVALLVMFAIALNIQKLELPTNESKLSASFGFVIVGFVLVMALFNRINLIFKIKSVGFFVMWIMFLLLDYIVEPMKWAFGLMMIPLLIDDMILKPIWQNVWYNQYDK